jgi:fibronectin-binding autotransporter adhesin
LTVEGLSGGTAALTPKATFQFIHLSEDSFADSGASGFDLSASGHATDSFQPFISASVAQQFAIASGAEITPELRLGYAYETLANSRLLTVTTSAASRSLASPRRAVSSPPASASPWSPAPTSSSAPITTPRSPPATPPPTIQAGLRWKF